MTDKKISDLTDLTAPASTDWLEVETAAGLSRKTNISDILALSSTNPIQGGMLNGYLSATVASNDLILAIKTLAGANPTEASPVYVRIGNTLRTISAALSVTAADGTNWCNLGAAEHATQDVDLFAYLGYNATDGVVIGFSRIPFGRVYSDFSATTTNEKFCKISTITSAAATDEYENVGRFNATLSAGAGYTWTIPATAIVYSRPTYDTRFLTYVPTIVGFTATLPTNTSYQYRLNGLNVELSLSQVTDGTSNATNFTISMPFTAKTVTNKSWRAAVGGRDNGATLGAPALAVISSAGTVVTLYSAFSGAAWTNANGKLCYALDITYQY